MANLTTNVVAQAVLEWASMSPEQIAEARRHSQSIFFAWFESHQPTNVLEVFSKRLGFEN